MADSPSVQTGTYPIAEDVLQLARSMINDMLRDVNGRILTDTAPFTLIYLNAAIRKTQRYFANNGLENYIKDNVILTGIPPCTSTDPSTQVFISPTGYFDGTKMNAQPTLPSDLIVPLAVWERPTGTGGSFTPVNPVRGDGLPSRTPGQTFDDWEWRNDNLNFVGCINQSDLKLRYEAAIPRILSGANLAQTSIPLRDAEDALGAGMCWRFAWARGSEMRVEAKKLWEDEMDQVINRFVRKDQRIAYRSRGFRAGGGPIDGALTGSTR